MNYYHELLPQNDLIINLSEQLVEACKSGDLDKVKYLLTSPELDHHADIHYKLDNPFNSAVFSQHLHIVKYLLTSDELKEHANLHADGDNAFVIAAYYNYTDILNYFIFDLNIEQSENIKTELADTPNIEKRINKLFSIRDLNNEIKSELSSENNKGQKKQVKI